MRTRNSYFPNNSSATIPRRQNKRRTPNVVEPELRTIVEMADNRTMEELLQAPMEGFEETFGEAWERFKEMLRACPHHGFTGLAQTDTFYNGFNDNDQDSLNAVAGGNLLFKTTREALQIIENKSKVRYSRNKPNVSRMNTTSRENVSKTDIYAKKVVTPALIKVVEKSCVTCGGTHAYYNCPNTDSNKPSICVATGEFKNKIQNTMKTQQTVLMEQQNDFQNNLQNMLSGFFQNQSLTSGTLPSNTIPNTKGEMKAITTRSGVAYEGLSISTPKEQLNFQGSIAHIQPPVTLIVEPDVPKTLPKPNIPYPSRLNDQKLRKKATNQKKLFLPELTPTRMTLDLVDRSITRPKGVAEDIFIKVGKFHFPTDFVVVDFEADPRVPLILRRSFLRTGRALINVYREEITLWVNDKFVTFNLKQTTRYSSTYDDLSVNQIDIIDVAREEYAQEILEEIDAYLKDESISSEINHADYDLVGDIYLIKKLLNDDPFQLPLMDLKQREVVKAKYSNEEPLELELKELPSHLEYAYLEGVDKLLVIFQKI
nr:reverse transcriptase domain-containing protein [Tanacetum cinerariifolium]